MSIQEVIALIMFAVSAAVVAYLVRAHRRYEERQQQKREAFKKFMDELMEKRQAEKASLSPSTETNSSIWYHAHTPIYFVHCEDPRARK